MYLIIENWRDRAKSEGENYEPPQKREFLKILSVPYFNYRSVHRSQQKTFVVTVIIVKGQQISKAIFLETPLPKKQTKY